MKCYDNNPHINSKMRHFERCTIQSSFKILCIVATGSMIIYWIWRFSRNEDVSNMDQNSEEVLTRHLLKLSEIEIYE